MDRRARLALGIGVPLALSLAVGLSAVALRERPAPLPDLGSLPDFSLRAHDGGSLTRRSLSGRPFVADFIFTRCGGICPGMTARMAQLQRGLEGRVALVSFSVDPEHDTPEVLAAYARDFKAGPGWTFATGPRADLYALATDGFRLAALEVPEGERQKGDGPFVHSAKFVLVDASAHIRGYYDSEDGGALEQLARDARRLLDEGS